MKSLRQAMTDGKVTNFASTAHLYYELVLCGALRTGQGKAAVIKGREPLHEREF